jgi:hypothetical protein
MATKKTGKEKKTVKITAEDIATARAVGVMGYPLKAIKIALKCSWKKAVQNPSPIVGEEKIVNSEHVAHSNSAALCPERGHLRTDFVFRQDGARCVECADSEMRTAVKTWRDGELKKSLADGLERYIAGECGGTFILSRERGKQ